MATVAVAELNSRRLPVSRDAVHGYLPLLSVECRASIGCSACAQRVSFTDNGIIDNEMCSLCYHSGTA